MTANSAVMAIYDDQHSAERAAQTLQSRGFSPSNISVLMPGQTAVNTLQEEGTTPARAAGGLLAFAAGLVGFAIPGLGPLLGAGPILAGLATIAGNGLTQFENALVDAGFTPHQAKLYQESILNGGILVAAHCANSDERRKAKDILAATGGRCIEDSADEAVLS